MDYVVTHTQAPHAIFVHGNHDRPYRLPDGSLVSEPGGWRDVDQRSRYLKDLDLLVAGLQGAPRYARHAAYQYTERQMVRRAFRLIPRLLWNRIRHGRYLDLLITHAPARGIHDTPEGAHRGFLAFRELLERFKPRLYLHGHHHRYGLTRWHTKHQDTEVVNVHPYLIMELDGAAKSIDLVKLSYDSR
jgi:Icc-related predicted phosphoesterase